MNLLYKVDIPRHCKLFNRSDGMSFWGSCFAEELQRHLYEELFEVSGSPFGVMYNPISIANGMERVLNNDAPKDSELFNHLNEWHSFMHHGDYSDSEKMEALNKMETSFIQSRAALQRAKLVVITFGTSYIYELKETGEVVNNCHKLSSQKFHLRRLSVEEITIRWHQIIKALRKYNPDVELLFTVSPICHYRDGAHENRLSKAILHLAIEDLCKESGVYYFPSYEIMQDELRDYRFYKDDFAHPNELAIRYVLERFVETFIDVEKEKQRTAQWDAIKSMIQHQPLTTHSPSIINLYQRIEEKLIEFRGGFSHPFLDVQLGEIKKKLASYEQI